MKRRRRQPNTVSSDATRASIQGRTFTQNEAIQQLRSSTKPGFGIFSTNADENLAAPSDRVYLLMRIPGRKDMPRLTLRTPEMAKQLIEDLIAHRRNVWPDAEPVDPEIDVED